MGYVFVAVPSRPERVEATVINSTAIMVSWQPPAPLNGVITAYNVWYNQTLNCSGSLVSFSDSVAGSVLMYTFTGLEEDTPYVFYVSAETSAGEGEAAMVMGRTSENGECVCVCVCVQAGGCATEHVYMHACLAMNAIYLTGVTCPECAHSLLCGQSRPIPPFSSHPAPSAAPEFIITAVTATSIGVAWQPLPPCEQNGVITNYIVAYRMEGETDMSFNEIVVDAPNRMHVVKPLTPYTNYTIKMAASTSVGRGNFGPEMTVQTDESGKSQSVQFKVLRCNFMNVKITACELVQIICPG